MPKYNVHWTEVCNVVIEAQNAEEAMLKWISKDYDPEDVSSDILDNPKITIESEVQSG